jgi:hypothetical protein
MLPSFSVVEHQAMPTRSRDELAFQEFVGCT